MKKFIVIIIILAVLSLVAYNVFFKKAGEQFNVVAVARGTITEEVSETGQIKKGEKINLNFNNSGQIEKIYVAVGSKVKTGDVLAKLGTVSLQIQLQEAQSSLAASQAQLNKLLAGATQEEIQQARTQVSNAQITVDSASQTLDDAYEDALFSLDDYYLKAYNAQNAVDYTQRTYFISNDQAGTAVKENNVKIKGSVSVIKSLLDAAKASSTKENVDSALAGIKTNLSLVFGYLKIVRDMCEEPAYTNTISATDKTSLDAHRININTALSGVVNAQQTIALAKISLQSSIGLWQLAKDGLNLILAAPSQSDIDLYQAQINQAKFQVQLYQNQIKEARMVSPADGEIAEINKREGEFIQPALEQAVMVLLPQSPFQIEADIYEEDVVKMNVGNPVEISLVAFPGRTFQGQVVSINPAEKLINEVVYYGVTIGFEEMPENLKPGMTVDITIQTAQKENVLVVTEDALEKRDGKYFAQVLQNNLPEEREIGIGIVGSDNMVEIISGLTEGEQLILE
jgi:RND family efflux transporter MFP subunit